MTHIAGTGLDSQTVFRELVDILNDVPTEWDRGLNAEIGRETKLVADLNFDSVDVVQLAIAIEEQFRRRKLPFEKLLMVDGHYVDDVSVGQLVDFLVVHLNGAK
jgi:acyl carrier protein